MSVFGLPPRPAPQAPRAAIRHAAGLLLLLCAACAPALRAQTEATDPAQDPNGLLRFMNRLPELVDQHLPFLAPGGTYWFYARPHVGDPLKGDYFRLDGGGWLKVNDNIDLNAGAQGFIWRDDNDSDSTRYGVSGYNLGVKYAHALSPPAGSAISVGLNFSSPLGRPPSNLTDGWRHTDPYVTYTRPLIPEIKLVGFTTVGLDLLDALARSRDVRDQCPPLELDHVFGGSEPAVEALRRLAHAERRDERAREQAGAGRCSRSPPRRSSRCSATGSRAGT